jgi:hypothetical protein
VETDRFIDILRNYSESTEDEALEVIALKERFPYSQLLHALSARMSKDHDFVDQQNELQLAAVYAADRRVLKEVMTLDVLPVHGQEPIGNKASPRKAAPARPTDTATRTSGQVEEKPAPKAKPIHKVEIQDDDDVTPDPGSVAEEVMHDLQKLHHLRHNFEMLFADGGSQQPGKAQPLPSKPVDTASEPVEKAAPPEVPKVIKPKPSSKSRKQRIIEMAKKVEAEQERTDEALEEFAEEEREKLSAKKKDILDEITQSKQEISPESQKQKEQLELIDQFIKTQPSISNKRDQPPAAPQGDLTTIKTGEFSDNVVSETLVDLLVKQGKNDKAIEVLKKLIWKFPQKKAYFAAQIQELKK